MKKTVTLVLISLGLACLCFVVYTNKARRIESTLSAPSLPFRKERYEQIEIKYNLRKELEEAFDLLSAGWRSKNKEDHFECKIDYREIKFRTDGKWKELDGVTVLMGMPQADFYYSGNSYKLAFSVDENRKSISYLSIIRESPLRSGVLDDMLLEKSE